MVTKNIFIGDHNAAADRVVLANYGITHIINCAREVENYFESKGKIQYLNLNLLDSNDPIIPAAIKAYNYIKSVLENKPGSVFLIHCHMGISRSASVVIYYMMKKYGHDYEKSLGMLKNIRPIVRPNDSYDRQLNLVD